MDFIVTSVFEYMFVFVMFVNGCPVSLLTANQIHSRVQIKEGNPDMYTVSDPAA